LDNGSHKGCRYKCIPVNHVAAALVAAIAITHSRMFLLHCVSYEKRRALP